MIGTRELVEAFARNVAIIELQTAGLTHADSVLQLPFRGNCLNWVIGHIVDSRDNILKALGEEGLLSPAQSARYRRGSGPITHDGDGVMRMEDLLAKLRDSQARLAGALEKVTPEMMSQEVPFAGETMPLDQLLFFLYFHDTYHLGQTEQLRQLAGTNDQIL